MEEKKEGWKWLSNSKFWHYFKEGRSLCGRYAVFSMDGVEQGNNESEDNCKKCKEKILKEVSSDSSNRLKPVVSSEQKL